MPKLRVHRGTYFVTLPKEYVESLGWKKGDTVVVAPTNEGSIIIDPVVRGVFVAKEKEKDDTN
jgi:AbrB family looped-hinge helix DNA binding protein